QNAISATGGDGTVQSHGSKWTVETNPDGSTTVTSPTGFSATKKTDENGNTTWEGTTSSGDTWSQDAEGNVTITTEDGTVITKSADGKTVTVEESDGGVGRVELNEEGNITDANFAEHSPCSGCGHHCEKDCDACEIEAANGATESETSNNQDQRGSVSPNGGSTGTGR
ncbi:MAG: hypothetical protein KDC38_18330, partial [Planctomycetes bacterium]|nr:hypothetical protein [Planctomycetota bacterium]